MAMSKKPGATRLSVSLPSALVGEFDSVWQGMKYTNRSKAVHDALRNFIGEYKWMQEEAEDLMGAIVLVYYLDKRGLTSRIMEIQHDFENVISSTMHVHLTKAKCLEIIGIKGNANDAKSLAQRLMAVKGVKQLKFAAMIP